MKSRPIGPRSLISECHLQAQHSESSSFDSEGALVKCVFFWKYSNDLINSQTNYPAEGRPGVSISRVCVLPVWVNIQKVKPPLSCHATLKRWLLQLFEDLYCTVPKKFSASQFPSQSAPPLPALPAVAKKISWNCNVWDNIKQLQQKTVQCLRQIAVHAC